nr:hypothetical protein CFP56_72027 [Quercus suber]
MTLPLQFQPGPGHLDGITVSRIWIVLVQRDTPCGEVKFHPEPQYSPPIHISFFRRLTKILYDEVGRRCSRRSDVHGWGPWTLDALEL